jgi:hypothetical protein
MHALAPYSKLLFILRLFKTSLWFLLFGLPLIACEEGFADEEMHPCIRAAHCNYDAQSQKASCAPGYHWQDPGNPNDYKCIASDICIPDSCAAENAECGVIPDGCGGLIECGSCTYGQTCGAAGTNRCGVGSCSPQDCAGAAAQCGSISDGCGATLACGNCPQGQSCGLAGIANQCGQSSCIPTTCAIAEIACGSIDDTCGGTLDCGTCPAEESQCGNGQLEAGEACDGSNLNNESCSSLTEGNGTLSCNAQCAFDLSQCSNPNSCPENAYAEGDSCYCMDGYMVNSTQDGCVSTEGACPPNASPAGNGCACDQGYVVNSTQDGCVVYIPEVCHTPYHNFPLSPTSWTDRFSWEYSSNNDFLVIDAVSGVMWQGCEHGRSGNGCNDGESIKLSWADAVEHCDNFVVDSYDDWYLPEIDQILVLTDKSGNPAPLTHVFVNSSEDSQLSSATYNAVWESYRSVVMEDGTSGHTGADSLSLVRCVRNTPEATALQEAGRCLEPGFSLNAMQWPTVKDELTGLMWHGCAVGTEFNTCINHTAYVGGNYQTAMAGCNEANWAGYTNWRLPSLWELESILDYSREERPFIDTELFKYVSSGGFWTTTKTSAGAYWTVNFWNGTTDINEYVDDTHGIRKWICVRNMN